MESCYWYRLINELIVLTAQNTLCLRFVVYCHGLGKELGVMTQNRDNHNEYSVSATGLHRLPALLTLSSDFGDGPVENRLGMFTMATKI